VAEQTRRYYAVHSVSYALAAIALVEHARVHRDDDFTFGPLDSRAMAESGLVVTGSDLGRVAAVLAEVPGLAEFEAGGEALARLSEHDRVDGPRG
jgi:hypothetical protein